VQTVNKAATLTTLSMAVDGLAAAVTAVAPGAGTPTGGLRVVDATSGTLLAIATLSGGKALVPLSANVDTVAASYSGDSNFQSGNSATLGLLAATNAASYTAAGMAADELVTLFSPNLFSPGMTAAVVTQAGGNYAATVAFVSPLQATIVTPVNVPAGPATLKVVTSGRTISTSILVGSADPGLFTADGSGHGAPAAQVIVVHADGTQEDPQPASSPIDTSDAVSVYLVLYGTGIRHAGTVTCSVGGQAVAVQYAGVQGSSDGLDQVNVLLPSTLKGRGAVPLIVTADGHDSNTVTLLMR
jgi:uncharacterized protein (TIGR03437 family)